MTVERFAFGLLINGSRNQIKRIVSQSFGIGDAEGYRGSFLFIIQFEKEHFVLTAFCFFGNWHAAFTAFSFLRSIKGNGLKAAHAVMQVHYQPAAENNIYKKDDGCQRFFHAAPKIISKFIF